MTVTNDIDHVIGISFANLEINATIFQMWQKLAPQPNDQSSAGPIVP